MRELTMTLSRDYVPRSISAGREVLHLGLVAVDGISTCSPATWFLDETASMRDLQKSLKTTKVLESSANLSPALPTCQRTAELAWWITFTFMQSKSLNGVSDPSAIT